MPLDLPSQEVQLLLRQFEKGNVVLFAGAGFSLGAQNPRRSEPPLARDFCQMLAEECGWKYTGEELPVVYDQARKHLGTRGMNKLLASLYKDCLPADWHRIVPRVFWYRIYTTNIDDVIENSFGGDSVQRLDSITCPSAYQEHDVWFDHIQCVHLHGSVLDFDKGFTFTLDEFAMQTVCPNPWYQALVDDMEWKSFIFVGTRINEAPLYHYMNLRTQRPKGAGEFRAKAFLVCPEVSQIRRRQFADQSIVVLDVTAEEFFRTIAEELLTRIPTKMQLLKNCYPHQIANLAPGVFEVQADVLREFDLVSAQPAVEARTQYRTAFFEGAEPTWDDIRNGVDAERTISADLVGRLRSSGEGLASFILVGHAGSGKSTVLRRAAVELVREGFTVYFCKSAQKVEERPLVGLISNLRQRHIFIFIDDAILHLDAIDQIASKLPAESNVTFVLADRPHVVYPRLPTLKVLKPGPIEMPYLDRTDCERIVTKLQAFGFLGALQGLSRTEQLRAFLGRSRKQLLVAMKEATSGRGFDVILAHEFNSLSGFNARLAYVVTCLAYMHGAPVRRRHLLACMDGSDLEKAAILANDLREVVVAWRESQEFLRPRHRVIAQQVATETAPVDMRKTALLRVMTQISAEITPQNISRRTPEYIAYRGIINFDNVFSVCSGDYDLLSEVYNDLRQYYENDFLFWVQFGRAELYWDNFAAAENYLNQSLGIRDVGNFQGWHHMGVLFLKRARYQTDPAAAFEDARRGEEILRRQVMERGNIDAYPYAALVTHKHRYLKIWKPPRMAEELQELYELACRGYEKHPFDDAMREAYQEVFREYLMQAVSSRKGPSAIGPGDFLKEGIKPEEE